MLIPGTHPKKKRKNTFCIILRFNMLGLWLRVGDKIILAKVHPSLKLPHTTWEASAGKHFVFLNSEMPVLMTSKDGE